MTIAANALCLSCGEQNHVGLLGFGARCTKCNAEIRFSTLGSGLRSSIPTPMGWRSWFAICAGVVIVIWALSSSDNSSPSYSSYDSQSYQAPYEYSSSALPADPAPAPVVEAAPTFSAEPVYISTGELRFEGAKARLAPLEIVTRVGSNYFIKLVNANTGVAEEFLFIRGGDRLEVQMPLGTYEMRYASGDVWYGEVLLFGPTTSYSRVDAPFEFRESAYQYEGYTIELYVQANGNLDMDPIPASQF